ncbi:DUF6920 family protein [Imhoffiella purpurea]|uniref:Uncharacterized protein n=1 Tax=Imhoffiella purpurea TaxID=1249627 RepID=W9W3W2_9GAMM|nr:DUF6544 family protein [Imhoffiella purpurea]EXJ17245.1 hypothetical protein D779_0072 [Imhoffiella purpurea]
MLLSVVLPLLFVLIVVPIVFLLYGIARWQSATGNRLERLEGTRSQLPTRTFDPNELAPLPEPVQRYFNAALTPGQPLIAVAELGHIGQLSVSERWAPFRSSQTVCTHRPGFDWDARIRRAPGVQVFMHDTYIAGEGSMKAALSGLFVVADHGDGLRLAQAGMMRFLAEAVWYPTKLLPSQGVAWEAIDETCARATLTDGDTSVALVFGFDETGMIRSARADARYRPDHGDLIETPWEMSFRGYETRSGMRVPIHGEAAWILPTGPSPYWRGQLAEALYKFAP